jgi:hypothetical protein
MVILDPDSKPRTPDDIDRLVSAELPDPNGSAADQALYHIVADLMMHGPCGTLNPECSCMQDGKCNKHYPRTFQDNTSISDAIYPLYRRCDNGRTVPKTYTHQCVPACCLSGNQLHHAHSPTLNFACTSHIATSCCCTHGTYCCWLLL